MSDSFLILLKERKIFQNIHPEIINVYIDDQTLEIELRDDGKNPVLHINIQEDKHYILYINDVKTNKFKYSVLTIKDGKLFYYEPFIGLIKSRRDSKCNTSVHEFLCRDLESEIQNVSTFHEELERYNATPTEKYFILILDHIQKYV